MVNMLDHEFYARTDAKSIDQLISDRLTELAQFKEISLTKDGKIVFNQAKKVTQEKSAAVNFSYISFFAEMSQYLYETYWLVLLACQEICQKLHVVRENKLVEEMHIKIKDMFSDN